MDNRNCRLHKRRKMATIPLISFLVLCLFSSSDIIPKASARFFPNVSFIPHDFHRNLTNPWDSFHKFAGCRAGEKLDGLSKLKQYFHNFGYLDSNPQNFTDDFDDDLVNAIRTYQRLFHLDVTGELDHRTLDLISRSRCGNADIVKGSTTMNFSSSSSHAETMSSSKLHAVSHYAIKSGKPWKSDLTYAFFDDTLVDDVTDVFARAFAKWVEVIPVKFTYTASFTDADIKIEFFSGAHGDGDPFDGPGGTLAHAFYPPTGWFHLDSAETWIVTSSTEESSSTTTAFDLESVARHEIGHLLGLGHSSVKEAVMYPTMPRRKRKVELAGDDVVGIQILYGSNQIYHRSAATRTETSEGGSPRSRPSIWASLESSSSPVDIISPRCYRSNSFSL